MTFTTRRSARSPGGDEPLLLDVIHGDATLFTRGDEVEHAWRVVMPILNAWEKKPATDFPNYAARNVRAPKAADRFLEKEGRRRARCSR